jgi:hypothetical protein
MYITGQSLMLAVLPSRFHLLVFVVSYLFFLLSLSENFSAAHDSIQYLNEIIAGAPLFHQHHLLYHFFAHYWFTGIDALFPSLPDHDIVQAFTAVWGAATLSVVYRFLHDRFGVGVLNAAAGTLLVCFTYGIWFYSTSVEVYAPSVFFCVASLYVASKPAYTKRDTNWLIALHALAIMFHQVNILLSVPIAVAFYMRRKQTTVLKPLLRHLLFVGTITLIAYWICGWLVLGFDNFPEWIRWIAGYTKGHNFWRQWDSGTVTNMAMGFGRAFIGGQFAFQIPWFMHGLSPDLGSHAIGDEKFLTAGIDMRTSYLLLALSMLFLVIFAVLALRLLVYFRHYRQSVREIVALLFSSIVTYSIFFSFWMPEIVEFWILQATLLVVIVAGSVGEVKHAVILFVCAALLFTVNYAGSIRPLMKKENDYYYRVVSDLKKAGIEQHPVLVEDGWIIRDYLKYFSKASVQLVDSVHSDLPSNGPYYLIPAPEPQSRFTDLLKDTGTIQIRSEHPRVFFIRD